MMAILDNKRLSFVLLSHEIQYSFLPTIPNKYPRYRIKIDIEINSEKNEGGDKN